MQGLYPLNQQEFWNIYDTFMKQDFPLSEIRKAENFTQLWKENVYEALGWYEKDVLKGYAFFVKGQNIVLLDYFAILGSNKGSGIGGKFLEAYKDYFAVKTDCILVETENPEFAVDEADRQKRIRRNSFYEKHGAYVSCVTTRVFTDEYQILVLPLNKEKAPFSANRAFQIQSIYETIFPMKEQWEQIKISRNA